jgi:uncharacterized glyoxalase superfamily protein PhnB
MIVAPSPPISAHPRKEHVLETADRGRRCANSRGEPDFLDADAIYARAKDAGATIVEDIECKPYGGRGFACLDPEGHIWHVGTYDPWAPK